MYEQTRPTGRAEGAAPDVMIGTYVPLRRYYEPLLPCARRRSDPDQKIEDCFDKGVHADPAPATPLAGSASGEKGADRLRCYLNDIFTVT